MWTFTIHLIHRRSTVLSLGPLCGMYYGTSVLLKSWSPPNTPENRSSVIGPMVLHVVWHQRPIEVMKSTLYAGEAQFCHWPHGAACITAPASYWSHEVHLIRRRSTVLSLAPWCCMHYGTSVLLKSLSPLIRLRRTVLSLDPWCCM